MCVRSLKLAFTFFCIHLLLLLSIMEMEDDSNEMVWRHQRIKAKQNKAKRKKTHGKKVKDVICRR